MKVATKHVAGALWAGLLVLSSATGQAFAQSPAPGTRTPGVSEEARRHLLRGTAAVEMAKSNEELGIAAEEFRKATELAPQFAIAWFNLGKVQAQLGHYADAIESYRRYLNIAPTAEDAQRVRDDIVKLEFRQELAQKEKARGGAWVGHDGTMYEVATDSNLIVLKTKSRPVRDEVVAVYGPVGSVPVTALSHAEYRLVISGNTLKGTWQRGSVGAEKCTVPSDTAEVRGELKDREKVMVLRHERSSFKAVTQMALLGDDSCASVTNTGRKAVEVTIHGPLGKAGIGAGITGLTQWWDGGFSKVLFGWQGRMGVKVAEGSAAHAAGLRDGDEILSIDGVPVKSLTAGEAMFRLHGEPGSNIALEVRRKDSDETLSLNFPRIQGK